MLPAARLAVLLVGFAPLCAAVAQPKDDPVHEDKKASEWVNILRNDTSPRKRSLAVVALGTVWSAHQYKDALTDIGRSLRLDPSAAVRAQCAVTITGFKPEAAGVIEKDIVDALAAEKEPRVRKELATAVGRFPQVAKKAVVPLTAVLKDTEPAARVAAADALAKAGADAKAAAPELVPLLDDADKTVRQAAVFALGRISPENPSFVAAALVKRYGEEKDAELRRETLVSLKLLGDTSEPVVTALAAALADPDAEARAIAVRTLGVFGTAAKPAADALLAVATKSPDKGLRVDAVRSFGSALGPGLRARVKDVIGVMENDPDFEVRLAAVEEVGTLGNEVKDDKDVMAALRKRLSDPQVKVREGAAAAIRRVEKKPEPTPGKEPDKKP